MLFGLLLMQTLQGQSVFIKLPKTCISLPHFLIAAGTPSLETTKIVSLLIFSIFVSAFFRDQWTLKVQVTEFGLVLRSLSWSPISIVSNISSIFLNDSPIPNSMEALPAESFTRTICSRVDEKYECHFSLKHKLQQENPSHIYT